jgi:hypothetical protein
MTFFVYKQDFEDPEIHILDIYVGPEPPGMHVDTPLKRFDDVNDLYTFLKTLKINQIHTYRHILCPHEVIEGLNHWIESNLSLRSNYQLEESSG